jgi:hypothetical protein
MRKLPALEVPMTLRTLRAAAWTAALTVLSVVSLAEGPATCPPIDHPVAAAPAAGVRAAIDRDTGVVRAPRVEERAAAEARRRAAHAAALRNVEVTVHPNGMRTAKLGDAFLFDVVVETRPDGTLGYRCVPRSKSTANLPTEEK